MYIADFVQSSCLLYKCTYQLKKKKNQSQFLFPVIIQILRDLMCIWVLAFTKSGVVDGGMW